MKALIGTGQKAVCFSQSLYEEGPRHSLGLINLQTTARGTRPPFLSVLSVGITSVALPTQTLVVSILGVGVSNQENSVSWGEGWLELACVRIGSRHPLRPC